MRCGPQCETCETTGIRPHVYSDLVVFWLAHMDWRVTLFILFRLSYSEENDEEEYNNAVI